MAELQSVYLETTIPSYLASRPSKDLVLAGEQLLTHEWWEARRSDFDLFVSDYVLEEAALGDPDAASRRISFVDSLDLLEINEASINLAESIIGSSFFPAKATVDAGHIAICCVHEMDFLLTWNCRHIANAQIIKSLNLFVAEHGYALPAICTPIELMEGGFDGR